MTQSRTEHIDKWVRGRLGDEVIVETRTPLLVWLGGFPPVYGFTRTEVSEGALRPTDASTYAGGWFFGPHQPVGLWYDVVAGHPRDPHKRVETLRSSRHVEVMIGSEVVAESDRPVLLLETDLPTRYYLPREDVRFDLLSATDNVSMCPYKGTTGAYWTFTGPPVIANVAWSYTAPLPAVAAVAGRVAFYNELVDLRVDGVLLERPESPFSKVEQRPGGE